MLVQGDKIFAVNTLGQIVIWDLTTLDTIDFNHNDTASYKFLSVGKDRNNRIFFGTDKGHIFKYDPSSKVLSTYHKIKYAIHSIFFNSGNEPILIVPYAVYDPVRKRHWSRFRNHTSGLIHKKRILRLFKIKTEAYFQMPQYSFLDSHDRLWMVASFGEFGGDVQRFDAKKFEIVNSKLTNIDLGLLFPKSVFEGPSGDVYITSGLQHFSNSGEIYRLKDGGVAEITFESSGIRQVDRKTQEVIDEGGMFIGPGGYNRIDSCIYFATDRGFFKFAIAEKGKSNVPIQVVNPDLAWSREPLAIGMGMAVKKLAFGHDGRLIFLTENDGIGLFDGQKLFLLR